MEIQTVPETLVPERPIAPRWLKIERFFVAASGISLCVFGAVWIFLNLGGGPGWVWRDVGPALVLVGMGLPYAATFYLLRRHYGHRFFHWVIVVLSFSIALFPPLFVLVGLLAGLRDLLAIPPIELMLVLSMKSRLWIFEIAVISLEDNGLWMVALAVLVSHACLSAAAREAYRQQGGARLGIFYAFLITAVLVASTTLVLLKWLFSW